MSWQNSRFVDTERKDYRKVYNSISSFLVWAALKLVGTNVLHNLNFCSVLHPRIAALDLYCSESFFLTLTSRCIKQFYLTKTTTT